MLVRRGIEDDVMVEERKLGRHKQRRPAAARDAGGLLEFGGAVALYVEVDCHLVGAEPLDVIHSRIGRTGCWLRDRGRAAGSEPPPTGQPAANTRGNPREFFKR